MKIATRSWDRKLWAVVHNSPTHENAMILGESWHDLRPAFYPGEASRPLLFKTRREAKAWCTAERARFADRTDFVAKWRFTPLRVRTRLTPL